MKLKNILYSAALVIAGVFSASCVSEEFEPAPVKVDKTVIDMGKDGGSEVVNLTIDGPWYVKYLTDSYKWLTVEPSSGVGSQKITVKVAGFKPSDLSRSALIVFANNNRAFSNGITINQKWAEAPTSVEYNKVSEVVDGGKYIIAAETKSGLLAAIPLEHTSESTYNYMYGTSVKDESGKIKTSSAANSFLFTKKGEGFAISGPDGRYIFQGSGYANFYTTDNLAKADTWTVTFDGDKATLKNTSVDATGKILQYDDVKYFDFGAWPSIGDGYVATMKLYKEVEDPSAPRLILNKSEIALTAFDTEALFSVDANDAWVIKVREGSDWVKQYAIGGTGKSDVKLIISKNNTGETRTAVVAIKGSGLEQTVTIVQDGTIYKTIKDMNGSFTADKTSYAIELKDAVVNYVNGGTFFLQDASGAVCGYISKHEYKAGDVLNGSAIVTGYLYNGLPEITSLDGATVKAGTVPEPVVATLDALLADYDSYMSKRVKLEGIKITKTVDADNNARTGELAQGKTTAVLYSQQKKGIVATAASEGDIIVVPSIYKTTKQLGFWEQADFNCKLQGAVVKFANSAVTVAAGKSVANTATTTSTATIVYSTKDADIAIVETNGNIIGVKEGETMIYASVAAVAGFSAAKDSCKVTVGAKKVFKLTNEEIVAAMSSFTGSSAYMNYAIESNDGAWTGSFYVNKSNTYLQIRNKNGALVKSPAYQSNIKTVTLAISASTVVGRIYHILPADTAVPTDATYSSSLWEKEYGNFKVEEKKAQTAEITIPATAEAKQFIIVVEGGAAYIDAITVEVE